MNLQIFSKYLRDKYTDSAQNISEASLNFSTQPAYSTGTGSMSSQDMYSRRSPAPFQGDRATTSYPMSGPSHSAALGGGGGYGGNNGAYGGNSGGYNGPPNAGGYG